MNKKGASKGHILLVSLSDDADTFLEDELGNLLWFNTFKEIYEFCQENGLNKDDLLLTEIKVNDKANLIDWQNIDEVEF